MKYEVLTPKKGLTPSSTLSTFIKCHVKWCNWGVHMGPNDYTNYHLARLLKIGESENNCDKLQILSHSINQKQLSFH